MVTSVVNRQRMALPALSVGKGTMSHLLLVTGDTASALPLQAGLTRSGFACALVSYADAPAAFSRQAPDLLILEIGGRDDAATWKLIPQLKKQQNLPVIALVPEQALSVLDRHFEVDDFFTCPGDNAELVLRINRLLHRTRGSESADQIKCDGLTIDLVTCEVTVDWR